MNKTNRIALWTGAAACVAAVGFIGLKTLMDTAIRREIPLRQKQYEENAQRARDESPYADAFRDAKAWLEAQNPEEIQIRSFDGLTLKGHLLKSPDAVRTAVYLHGWRENWNTNLGLVARFLVEHHTNVILPEQRSHGASEGEYIGFGILERRDLQEWADFASARFPDLPLYLGGVSMGAATCLMASDLPLPANVRGIVADSGYTSPRAILTHYFTSRSILPEWPVMSLENQMVKLYAGYRLDECSAIEALRHNKKIPVLFFHGDSDKLVPLAMSLENYLACSAPKELVIVEGAGHGMSYLVDKETCEDALLRFFARCDRA